MTASNPASATLACVRFLRSQPAVTADLQRQADGTHAIFHTRFQGLTVEGSGKTALLVAQSGRALQRFDGFGRVLLHVEAWSDPSRNAQGALAAYDQDEKALQHLERVIEAVSIQRRPFQEAGTWQSAVWWPEEGADGALRVVDCSLLTEPTEVKLPGDQKQADGLARYRVFFEVCYG